MQMRVRQESISTVEFKTAEFAQEAIFVRRRQLKRFGIDVASADTAETRLRTAFKTVPLDDIWVVLANGALVTLIANNDFDQVWAK